MHKFFKLSLLSALVFSSLVVVADPKLGLLDDPFSLPSPRPLAPSNELVPEVRVGNRRQSSPSNGQGGIPHQCPVVQFAFGGSHPTIVNLVVAVIHQNGGNSGR